MKPGSVAFNFCFIVVICLLSVTSGCSGKSQEIKTREDAIKIAENYAGNQLSDPRTTILKDGTITIGDSGKSYIIEAGRVFVGNIDADNTPDAIVTVTSYSGTELLLNEHLVMINTSGKLLLIKAVESDMKILAIKDRLVVADVPTHSRNSPLFNCPKCREVIKYRFINGDLQKAE
jgi:hypothetical protein